MQGEAGRGEARQDLSRRGEAGRGLAGPGKARLGAAMQGEAGRGLARLGAAGQGMAQREANEMKTVTVRIKGIAPLLMHRFPLLPVEAFEKKAPEEQAEISAYRDPDSNDLYIPGAAVQRGLVSAASYSKGRGRSTLQRPVAACVLVEPERLSLGVQVYKIDSRAAVNPPTKGRIVRHRPRIDSWEATMSITYDETLLTEKQLRTVVDDLGSRVGLLDFRPEKRGPFGRFMVTAWQSTPEVRCE